MSQPAEGGTILLLGATGRVGRLLRAIWDGPAQLVPVGRSGDGLLRWSPGEDPAHLPSADTVAAFWGVVPGGPGDLGDNVGLAEAATALARGVGARRVLHCSTGAVYRPEDGMLAEHTTPDPRNDYGRAKVAMERRVAALSAEGSGGPRSVCLRIGNVAGAESLFASIEAGQEVTLDRFPDGRGPERSYIAPCDLARVIAALHAAEPTTLPDIVNVAAPRATPMADIARAAGRRVLWRAAPEAAVPRVALDTARLARFCRLPEHAAEPLHLVAGWRRASGQAA